MRPIAFPGFSWERLANHPTEVKQAYSSSCWSKNHRSTCRIWSVHSQIVWAYKGSCGMVVTRTISHNRQITDNSYGLIPQPIIPQANHPPDKPIQHDVFYPQAAVLLVPGTLPACFDYLAPSSFTSWKRIQYGYLFSVPAVIQSLVLALVSLNAADFRYQYASLSPWSTTALDYW